MEKEMLLKLPKIDLHCHLDGSLQLGTVRTLLGRDVAAEELQVAEDCKSLAEYLEKFSLPLSCMQTAEGLRLGSKGFIEEVAKESVRYVEVRFAPQFSVNDKLSCRQVIESVLEGLENGKKQFGVDYQVIACAMRHLPEEENYEMLRVAREFLGEGVCAADLAGDEAAFPMSGFVGLFEQVKKLGMPFTLHAGECGSAANVRDSILSGAGRIGHGIAMRGQTEVKRLCRERKVGIEMCPISNMQTKAVGKREDYPIREFLDEGLLVTLNTDNRTVSNTTLTKEINFVQEHFGVTDEEVIRMFQNAVETAFVDEERKVQMRKWYE